MHRRDLEYTTYGLMGPLMVIICLAGFVSLFFEEMLFVVQSGAVIFMAMEIYFTFFATTIPVLLPAEHAEDVLAQVSKQMIAAEQHRVDRGDYMDE